MHDPHVSIHTLQNALLTSIGPYSPKPTSTTEGQTEPNMSVWKAAEGTEAGDLLVMPSGWRGVWHVHEPVRKVYVVVPDPLL